MTTAEARDPRYAIRTASGQLFWPLDPREEEIQLEDLAHALSHLCRFVGHARTFLSVAQHSVLVSRLCLPADALWGLLHDGAEAYLGDVARPLKQTDLFASYRVAEARLQALVYRRFGLEGLEPASVKTADSLALHAELRDVVSHTDPAHAVAADGVPAIVPQRPEVARYIFMERFHALVKGR